MRVEVRNNNVEKAMRILKRNSQKTGSLMNCENESSTHRRVRRGDTNVLQLNADRNVILKNEWLNKDTKNGIEGTSKSFYNVYSA